MKKRLLKPPQKKGEILFLPEPQKLVQYLSANSTIGTCHQLSFFHPGIAIRFIFLDLLKKGKKKIFFMDTDKTSIEVRIPQSTGKTKRLEFIAKDEALCNIEASDEEKFKRFFHNVEQEIRKGMVDEHDQLLENLIRFQEIFFREFKDLSFKEQLAQSFIKFNNIHSDYIFFSDITKDKQFKEFLRSIYRDDKRFRTIYNEALDEYSQEFLFRYRNFPFPKLKEDELPFWIVYDGRRFQFKKRDISPSDIDKCTIFPKASPLTLFLRLYMTDIFIHGVGGANYEWINERIIERFFKKEPPPYFVMSATFYIDEIPERDYPYFFINPEVIRKELVSFMKKKEVEL